jgi:acetylornithine/LysW-gamma-L-lysine aminotransferase
VTPEEIRALEARYATGVIPHKEMVFVRGEGAHLLTADGTRWLDLASGHGVALLGHGNAHVAAALGEQAAKLITITQAFPHELRARLAERLCRMAPAAPGGPLEKVFFCNSGTEAVEAALKFSRMATGRKAFVAFKRAFHGRTMGSLSATWSEAYRGPFEPLVPGFTHVGYDDAAALTAAVSDTTAAVIVEVVQGEGGVRPGSADFFAAVQDACARHGALLIVDEIQTGFGRTGRWFACEHFGLKPDLLCVAKGMAGGFPMGAVLTGPAVKGFGPGLHGSTFGGNPLACAAAMAALDEMERLELPRRAAELGAHAVERVRGLGARLVREVRGLGLMIGIEMRKKVAAIIDALAKEHHVVAINAGPTVLRLLPPLVIERADLDRAIDAIGDVLSRSGPTEE